MKKVMVIGGTGFVGRQLVASLLQYGYSVDVLIRSHVNLPITASPVQYVFADVHHDDLVPLFLGADAVINLVGILHQHAQFDLVHKQLPERITQACVVAGVPRFLHVSALGAAEDGPSAYLKSKFNGEQAVKAGCQQGTSYTIFRPSVILGKNDHFITMFTQLMRTSPVLTMVCPQVKLQPISVVDVALAITEAISMPLAHNKTYSLCGPTVFTLLELVKKIAVAQNRHRLFLPLSSQLSYLMAWLLEFTPGPLMTRDNYLSLQKDNVCDTPFSTDFSWTPKPVEQFLSGEKVATELL